MFACTWKNKKAVDKLISLKNKRDDQQHTALMYAAQVGFTYGVKQLLDETKA